MPGASTPPTYSPSGDTTSKFVEVPKSTTMHGAPYRSFAATAFAIRSGRPRVGRRSASEYRSHARAEDEQRRRRPALCEHLVLADQRGYRRREADAVDRLEVDEAADERAELVARALGFGRHAPVLDQLAVVEQPEDRLGVTHVDGKQRHGGEPTVLKEVGGRRQAAAAAIHVSRAAVDRSLELTLVHLGTALDAEPLRLLVPLLLGLFTCRHIHLLSRSFT